MDAQEQHEPNDDAIDQELQAMVAGELPSLDALQASERAKWLTIAEAQRLLDEWHQVHGVLHAIEQQYEGHPEDPQQAAGFVQMFTMAVGALTQNAVKAAHRVHELNNKPQD